MPGKGSNHSDSVETVWRYLVDDYLDIACFLTKRQRSFLIECLHQKKLSAKAVERRPCLLLEDHLLIITEGQKTKEIWLYDAEQEKIDKHRLRPHE